MVPIAQSRIMIRCFSKALNFDIRASLSSLIVRSRTINPFLYYLPESSLGAVDCRLCEPGALDHVLQLLQGYLPGAGPEAAVGVDLDALRAEHLRRM